MSRGKKAFGIAVLLALTLSAFAAGSASAKGTTGYTCVKGKGVLNGAHCLGTSGGEYGHVEIKPEETTTTTATNSNTASETTAAQSATIRATLAGVNTEITCKEIHGEGSFENRNSAEGEMYLHSEGSLHFTGCVVKAPAGKGCKVQNETLITGTMTSTSLGQGDAVIVQPKEGTKLAELVIEGCSIEALNGGCPITGSIRALGPGATLTTTHSQVTADNTMKAGGQKAGLEISVTVKAHSKAGEETNPISVTTT